MTTQTPDAVREAVDPRVEIAAEALGLHRYRHFDPGNGPTVRWPNSPQDTLSGRDGTVPLTWEFAEQCRAEVRAILAALDSRAGDAGEGLDRLTLLHCAEVIRDRAVTVSAAPLGGGYVSEASKIAARHLISAAEAIEKTASATPAPAVDATGVRPTCKTCDDRRTVTFAADTCQPERQGPCPVCVGTTIASLTVSPPAVDAVPAGEDVDDWLRGDAQMFAPRASSRGSCN